MQYYILDKANRVHEAPDMESFKEFFSHIENRRIAVSQDPKKKTVISTVFLGVDHNFSGHGDPVLFETMVFPNGEIAEEGLWRDTTYQDAVQRHQEICSIYKITPTI